MARSPFTPFQRVAWRPATALLFAIACLLGVPPAGGEVMPVGPFAGEMSESFNYSSVTALESLPVFDEAGALTVDLDQSPDGAIKIEWSSQFLGKTVTPISTMMGGQLAIANWTFDEPVSHFGGWWENNSGEDDATVSFYDVNDQLIDTAVATIPFMPPQGWTWNGWTSDVPIARIEVVGNGVVNGFIWYENMQIITAPQGTPGDLNGDGAVDMLDLLGLLSAWGACDQPGNCAADLNQDALVDVLDLLILLANWS